MIRVALVDDHILTLKGTQQVLSETEHMLIVGAYTDGHLLLDLLASEVSNVDLVITDLNMPKINGVDLCKRIKRKYPAIKVLILSMIDEPNMVFRMLKYGADGYLLKNEIQNELMDAITSVLQGKKYFNQPIDHLLSTSHNPNERSSRTMRPNLSRREKEVLDLIIKEYTTPEIAEALFISEGTVATHRKHILSKMGVKNTAGIVRVAIEWSLL
ncbi:MAG: response regulator transcription factor [Saprospiraceae bacterium]|nr:response regulator transcription factor [Saprospiraceae bacterium]